MRRKIRVDAARQSTTTTSLSLPKSAGAPSNSHRVRISRMRSGAKAIRIKFHLPDGIRNEWLPFPHFRGDAAVQDGRLIIRVQFQRAVKTRKGIAPPAQSSVSQRQVAVGLNMLRIFTQQAVKKLDGHIELPKDSARGG